MSVSVPYTTELKSSIQPGQSIYFDGKVNDDAKRINLLRNGTKLPAADAILHIDFRFEEGKAVYNTLVNGTWQKEERESLHLKKGQDYAIRIRALPEAFEIRINHEKVHEYKHREPFNSAQYLQVEGDTSMANLHWDGRIYELPYTSGFPDHGSMPAGIFYARYIIGTGQKITLYAIPTGDRWNVDFIARNGDILFHWNPRFGEKAVVRNSQVGKVWGKEEREGPFPFKKNVGSEIIFINEPFSIQIWVDGHQIGTFQHRCGNPAADYIGFRIDGEVDIATVYAPVP